MRREPSLASEGCNVSLAPAVRRRAPVGPCEPLEDTCGLDDGPLLPSGGAQLPFADAIALALEEVVPARTKPATSQGSTGLTRRELEIAELVAQGMSNKDIAGRLVASTRTVVAHVEHILTKLAFTSRSQIAAWMAYRTAESR